MDRLEKSIVLKNIDLRNVDFWEQRDKFIEDMKKFDNTVVDCLFAYEDDDLENAEKCKKRSIEEFWDIVQTSINILQKININADEVMAEYPKHLEKMESRGNKPREKVQE